MDAIKVILVDDHPVLREIYFKLLKRAGEIEIIGEFGLGKDAVMLAQEKTPDIIILDYYLPDMNALDLVHLLNGSSTKTLPIILTGHLNQDIIQSSLDQGVRGYIAKEDALDCLAPSIHLVMRGDIYLSPTVRKYYHPPFSTSNPEFLGT